MSEKLPETEWTLPVVDSDISMKPTNPDFLTTGAWTVYAIGAVTKNLLKTETNKKFPFIEESDHPAHLGLLSDNSTEE